MGRGYLERSRFFRRLSRFEPLEARKLLHAVSPVAEPTIEIGTVETSPITSHNEEAAPDLVAFAKALADAGVKMYGAAWCPACTSQKELFEDGGEFLPFIEVTNPDRTLNQIGRDEEINSFPTWEFQDGSRLTGEQSLATLSQRSGVAIPQSNQPSIAPIDDTTLLVGSPLHIPLNGYDPNSGPLTYTVTTSSPSVQGTILQGNRSMRVSVAGFGDMVFELFENRTPRATQQIIALAESGFYDGLIFHRIIDNFMIQGGDPEGDGSGGSLRDDFDDEFHVDLQHNRSGLLSMAKSADDSNNSQFFITDVPTRHLDFNHTIFGILTEGDKNRDAINNTDTVIPGDRPVIDVVMDSVSVFQDNENGVLMLKATDGFSGTVDVTVRVADQDGHFREETFQVTVQPDNVNTNPYLEEIPEVHTTVDTPVTFQLTSVDVEGDSAPFWDEASLDIRQAFVPVDAHPDLDYSVDPDTGLVTVTPRNGLTGTHFITVAVGTSPDFRGGNLDYQTVPITIAAQTGPVDPPTGVSLAPGSDAGFSSTDGLTNQTTLTFIVSGLEDGAQVELFAGNTLIGEGTASGSTLEVMTTNPSAFTDGVHSVTATQTVGGTTSERSEAVSITIDTVAPVEFNIAPPAVARLGSVYSYDAGHPEEGTPGFVYRLVSPPAGMTIDADTGVITWTPTESQLGNRFFALRATDAAGNSRVKTISVAVSPAANSWRNPVDPLDVDGDGSVTATDANQVLTDLNTNGSRELGEISASSNAPPPFVDVNGDGFATPLDALIVMNKLNEVNAAPPAKTNALASLPSDPSEVLGVALSQLLGDDDEDETPFMD